MPVKTVKKNETDEINSGVVQAPALLPSSQV